MVKIRCHASGSFILDLTKDMTITESKSLRRLQRLLFSLVLLLTFEGVFRKKVSGDLKTIIFFLKDFWVILIGFQLLRIPRPPALVFLWKSYGMLALFMTPVVIATALKDPLLALFGAKQYLLFPIVGLAVFTAFYQSDPVHIVKFLQRTALLVIPTSLLALAQSRLPPDHWLNLSVTGENLQDFSAGGMLRVSATFPFVAQYSMFLNLQMFVVIASLYRLKEASRSWKIICLSLPPFLILGMFITGSRTAVTGNLLILGLASSLILLKRQATRALQVALLVVFCYGVFLGVKHVLPEAFVAYAAREEGNLIGVSQESHERTVENLFGWFHGSNVPFSLFGYGIGVMSNGSDLFSSYARSWRGSGAWTETDYATTFFEGGLYLMLVWYGIRYFIVFETTRRYLKNVTGTFAIPGAFCQGFVISTGVFATLGIQPPIAIWWWLGVGFSLLFWWKCVEPLSSSAIAPPDHAEHTINRKFRGRSAYAERLHSGVS